MSRLSPLLSSLRSASRATRVSNIPVTRIRAVPLLATAICSATAYIAITNSSDISDHFNNAFLIHADSAAQPDFRDDPKSKPAFRVDPETSIPFPLTISLSSETPPLALVGLGVRKVSFLRVKVYSAGFYLQEGVTRCLQHIPGWQTYSAQQFLTPPTNTYTDPLAAPQLSGEGLMESLLDQKAGCAVRIVPNRNTDFNHLRDAFTRSLLARQKAQRSKGLLSEEDEQRITDNIQLLKQFFPSQTVQKGKSLVLLRPPQGGLVVEFEGTVLGQLTDQWIGKNLILAYFADEGAVSEQLKQNVAQGLEGLIHKRPLSQ